MIIEHEHPKKESIAIMPSGWSGTPLSKEGQSRGEGRSHGVPYSVIALSSFLITSSTLCCVVLLGIHQ